MYVKRFVRESKGRFGVYAIFAPKRPDWNNKGRFGVRTNAGAPAYPFWWLNLATAAVHFASLSPRGGCVEISCAKNDCRKRLFLTW